MCRVAIFEKLATVSQTSFDDADLLQLYQAQSLLDPPGGHQPKPAIPCLEKSGGITRGRPCESHLSCDSPLRLGVSGWAFRDA